MARGRTTIQAVKENILEQDNQSFAHNSPLRAGIGKWCSFYRENPHRLAIDYFGIKWLKPFQQALIVLCLKHTYTMVIASRGMGKSLIAALVCVIKCILYPRTQICVAAGKRGQSLNILSKIHEDLMSRSQNLTNEILDVKISMAQGQIIFKNGSTIKVVTASDSARSARAHFILADEFVQISKTILDKVIRKFKAGQRTPRFHQREEYKDYPKEPNTELYISSAYYKSHYSYGKFKSFFKSMVTSDSYFLAGFPYQLPVSNGYYPAEQIRDEMLEDDWDSIGWGMEMDSLFFGESERSFYSFNDIDSARTLEHAIYPTSTYTSANEPRTFKLPPKKFGEIRLISMDVATQGGTKNDATCFAVLQLLPLGSTSYTRNLVYMTTLNGGHTTIQALKLRRLFTELECDYVVIDTVGVGIAVYDNLMLEQEDHENGRLYPAWSCINDENMASRCTVPQAPKIIYSIKANAQFNSDATVSLRDVIRQGKLKFLLNENDAKESIQKVVKKYDLLSIDAQVALTEPYYQTTALANEMVNLSFEIVNGKIKVSMDAGKRKDRFSALVYGSAVASQLERELKRQRSDYEFKTFIN